MKLGPVTRRNRAESGRLSGGQQHRPQFPRNDCAEFVVEPKSGPSEPGRVGAFSKVIFDSNRGGT